MKMIQQAVAAEPDNAAYRDSLGWVLYRLGRYRGSGRGTGKGGPRSPTPRCWNIWATPKTRLARAAKASESWRRAARCFPQRSQDEAKAKQVEKKIQAGPGHSTNQPLSELRRS